MAVVLLMQEEEEEIERAKKEREQEEQRIANILMTDDSKLSGYSWLLMTGSWDWTYSTWRFTRHLVSDEVQDLRSYWFHLAAQIKPWSPWYLFVFKVPFTSERATLLTLNMIVNAEYPGTQLEGYKLFWMGNRTAELNTVYDWWKEMNEILRQINVHKTRKQLREYGLRQQKQPVIPFPWYRTKGTYRRRLFTAAMLQLA